jgi:hypothetical protein
MRYWCCLLALCLVQPACAGQASEEPGMSAVLDAERREATLGLPASRAERMMVEVRPIPGRASGGTVSVFAEGMQAPLARFTLYPPDRPGRFAFTVPAAVRELHIRFDPVRQGGSAAVTVQLVAAPER